MNKLQKIAIIVTILSSIIACINGLIDLYNKVELMENSKKELIIITEYIVCNYTKKEKFRVI